MARECMVTIGTEVQVTMRRMTPLIWAAAFGLIQDQPFVRGGLGNPEGNRRARRKAAALLRKDVPVVAGAQVFRPASPDTLRVARGQPEVRQA
ncbi:hypothetical protein ACXIT0_21685 [Methylorubrum extorquens]